MKTLFLLTLVFIMETLYGNSSKLPVIDEIPKDISALANDNIESHLVRLQGNLVKLGDVLNIDDSKHYTDGLIKMIHDLLTIIANKNENKSSSQRTFKPLMGDFILHYFGNEPYLVDQYRDRPNCVQCFKTDLLRAIHNDMVVLKVNFKPDEVVSWASKKLDVLSSALDILLSVETNNNSLLSFSRVVIEFKADSARWGDPTCMDRMRKLNANFEDIKKTVEKYLLIENAQIKLSAQSVLTIINQLNDTLYVGIKTDQ